MRRHPRSLSGVLPVATLLLLIGCSGGDPAPTDPSVEDVTEVADELDVESSMPELETQPVRLFFPSSNAEGLVGEDREIFATEDPGDRVKQIVSDLIAGPNEQGALAAIPAGTTLRQAWVLEDGTAYLDFTDELSDRLPGGSAVELLTVYAIVDSVVLNVPEVQRVGVLVGGRSIESLNGHVDLRRPLGPNRGLISGG